MKPGPYIDRRRASPYFTPYQKRVMGLYGVAIIILVVAVSPSLWEMMK